jgi:hypothetical protein
MEVYLGMALSWTPCEWREEFEPLVRSVIADIPEVTRVTEFQGVAGDADTVYQTDIKLARSADLMIALTEHPSIGLGMEIQARIELGKPTFVLHTNDSSISRMLFKAPLVEIRYYEVDPDPAAEAQEIQSRVAHYIQQMV